MWGRGKKVIRDEEGSITIETALVAVLLNFIGVGVLDFGLAFAHKMQLANAVRAGMQYAVVRKPVDGDYSAIINAVTQTVPTATEHANRTISVTLTCECPDGSTIDCVGEDGEDLTCDDSSLRAAYLDITVNETYDMLLNYPGLPATLSFSETAKVRLN